MTVMVIILLLLLFLSFSAAGLEVAFYSLSYKDINLLKTKPQQAYKRVIDLLEEPKVLLASLQIAKVVLNVFIVVLSNYIINSILLLSGAGEFLFKFVVIASVILLFGEILPRLYANYNSIRFAKDFGFVGEALYLMFNRIGTWMVGSAEAVEKKLAKKTIIPAKKFLMPSTKRIPKEKLKKKTS